MSNLWLALSAFLIGGYMLIQARLLARGKIPISKRFGFRFPQSLKSEKNWYAINEYGGKILIPWILPFFIIGIIGMISSEIFKETYFYFWIVSLLLGTLIPGVLTYRKAKAIDRKNAEQDAAANP